MSVLVVGDVDDARLAEASINRAPNARDSTASVTASISINHPRYIGVSCLHLPALISRLIMPSGLRFGRQGVDGDDVRAPGTGVEIHVLGILADGVTFS